MPEAEENLKIETPTEHEAILHRADEVQARARSRLAELERRLAEGVQAAEPMTVTEVVVEEEEATDETDAPGTARP